jgi:hypothetical protein
MHLRKRVALGACAAFALPLVSVAGVACDTPPPTYSVQSTILQLIPDTPAVSSAGGDVVVVVELSGDVDASASSTMTVVQAFGASLTPLPGGSLCAPPDAGAIPGAQGPSQVAAARRS